MIPMSPLICAANATAPPAGSDAPVNRTTDASRNGCSAMAKMIVAITVMSCQKIVQLATPKLISSVPTIDAFQSKCR